MVFKNILVPVDDSEHSNRAVEYASEFASKFDSQLILLHVYFFTPPISTSAILLGASSCDVMSPETVTLLSEKAKKDANQILVQAKKLVKEQKVTVNSLLRDGGVVPEILKMTEAKKIDLIVIGARGISGLKKLVLGSTSEAVAHKASCPILIVK